MLYNQRDVKELVHLEAMGPRNVVVGMRTIQFLGKEEKATTFSLTN
jgi:hypothetical protein